MRPPQGEVSGVPKPVYWQVVDNCYLCDMCFMTKCPYVPPHAWNVDFPHLMLRAKALKAKQGGNSTTDRLLASTEAVGNIAGIPVVAQMVNAVNQHQRRPKTARQDAGRASGSADCRNTTRAPRVTGSSVASGRRSCRARRREPAAAW